ncbi:MAG: hypothetical protein KDA41_15755, partial [Planctomycetales bacterium]|nr:hypothetical protein [Planctomycetales bacterium]
DVLEAVAEQSPEDVNDVWAAVDAQREQWFAARFRRAANGTWRADEETAIVDAAPFAAQLGPGDALTGPVVARLRVSLPAGVKVVPLEHALPLAETIGRLAQRQYAAGRRDDLWTLAPLYFRPSAAEENAVEKLSTSG